MAITVKQSTPQATQKFSILIPSWNNLPYLQLCIQSIQKHSTFAHQIIVIINEGKDGTIEWVANRPELDYILSENNLGICHGLNAGATIANTSYVLYINDDMYALPDWDKHLYDEIISIGHNNFMLSATMIEPTNSNNPCVIVADYGQTIASFKESELLSQYKKFQKSDWCGSTWPPNILHKETWTKIGGMSEEFSPGMYSDPDLSMKCWRLGIRYFKGLGQSRVYHFGSRSTKKLGKNIGKRIFLRKWRITPGTFSKHYLRTGQKWIAPLPAQSVPPHIRIKDFIKYHFLS